MTIQVGDKIPAATLFEIGENGLGTVTTDELFAGKTVVLFNVPGAFTPTCSAKHLPGFIEKADELKAKGVDAIICMAVNDPFVMKAWGKDVGAGDKVRLVSDGNCELTRKLGLEMDGSKAGLGTRCQRFSLIAKDGVVTHLNVEQPGAFEVSSAEYMLGQL